MSIDSIVSLTDDIVPGVGIGGLVIGRDIREDIIQHIELNQLDRRYWFELHDHTIRVRLGEKFSYNIASIDSPNAIICICSRVPFFTHTDSMQ